MKIRFFSLDKVGPLLQQPETLQGHTNLQLAFKRCQLSKNRAAPHREHYHIVCLPTLCGPVPQGSNCSSFTVGCEHRDSSTRHPPLHVSCGRSSMMPFMPWKELMQLKEVMQKKLLQGLRMLSVSQSSSVPQNFSSQTPPCSLYLRALPSLLVGQISKSENTAQR